MSSRRFLLATLAALLALGAPGVRPAMGQPTATYVPFPATPGNILVGDVDLTPRIVPATGFAAVSYLPTRSSLICLNTVTNTIAATVPLPSPSVRGIDPQFTPDASKMVVMTVGHLAFFDVTVTPPVSLGVFPNTDTPISDCDPQIMTVGGIDYCVVPYVGSVRVLTIGAGGIVTDTYLFPRTSIGLDAVDPVQLGANVFVPNMTTVDCFSLSTGTVVGSTVNPFAPKREIDMVPLPALGKVYWPLDGAVVRYDPLFPGLADALIPIPGTTVEGVDMGVMANTAYPAGLGAFPTTGFVNLIDLGAATLISACPTPGAVVRNFDPLMTNWNLVGAVDGLIYWSVIGTTYAIDMSAPFAPFTAIPTPGGLTDGVDLTASNNLARAVLPHPGFVHVINLPTATLVGGGIIPTPGTLKVDVDPLFPTTPASVAIGTRIVQPYLGGLLIVGGLSGSANQCVLTTIPNLYVLNLATMTVMSTFALGTTVSGVDPVLTQGTASPFDDNSFTVRDRDQDFLCNRAQMQPYWCRPWFLPYWPIRSPWWRAWGLPALSQFDAWGRVKLEVLEDGRTVAVLKPNGQVSTLLTLNAQVIGGAVYDRDWRYCKFYLRGNQEAIIDLTPFNVAMLTPNPLVKYVSFPGAVYWPPAHDYWNGYEILLTHRATRLAFVNSWTGVVAHTLVLPAPAIYPVSMDYKNKLCSVLLRGNRRYVVDLHPFAVGTPPLVRDLNVFALPGYYHWRPMINTIYDPMNLCSLDLMYNPYGNQYCILASHAVTGAYLWHHILPYRPYGRIYVEKKSKLAKVPLHNGYEFLADLGPLAWGVAPRTALINVAYPWTYEPVWDYLNRWEINCHAPNVITVVDAYRFNLFRTIFTPYPIIAPPVIDPMNKYLRVRLAGGHSFFVDLFALHRGDADYTRLDSYGSDLADDALFDPTGGYDLAATTDQRLIITRSRTGAVRHVLNLPGQLARPMLFDPHNRVAELMFQNGQMGMLDMSLLDESGNNAPQLQLANLPMRPLPVADQTPPLPPNSGLVAVADSIGADGLVLLTAPPGTVEPNSYVALINQSNESVEPTEVMADDFGGFTAYVSADSGEFVCLLAADVASNVSLPSCLMVDAAPSAAPEGNGGPPISLLSARPNPFHNSVEIHFSLAASEAVAIEVFDVSGRIVRQFGRQRFEAGEHQATWDARDDDGKAVAGGVYFVRVLAGNRPFIQRVVRMP